jgi:hypothetical protein
VLAVQRDNALFIKHDFFIGFLFERIVGRGHPKMWKTGSGGGEKPAN